MPDSFMPAYSQSSQPDPSKLRSEVFITSDVASNTVKAPAITSIALNDNASHNLNSGVALDPRTRYEVQIVPNDPTKLIRGWLCPGTPATVKGGPYVASNLPPYVVCFAVIDGPTVLSFIRDPAYPDACDIYLNLREAAPPF